MRRRTVGSEHGSTMRVRTFTFRFSDDAGACFTARMPSWTAASKRFSSSACFCGSRQLMSESSLVWPDACVFCGLELVMALLAILYRMSLSLNCFCPPCWGRKFRSLNSVKYTVQVANDSLSFFIDVRTLLTCLFTVGVAAAPPDIIV